MRGGEADLRRLLLISNSTQYGRGFLDHVESEMRDFLGPRQRILFVPFAMFDREGSITLKGSTGARIFRRGEEPVEARAGAELRPLLSPAKQGSRQ